MSGGLVLAKRDPSGMENPPAGKVRLFVNDDGQLCAMDETGQIVAPEELVSSVEAALSTEASARGAAEATLTAAAAAAKTTADAALPKAGGTMTGDIVLKGDPTANLHPATKQYVAAQIANVIAGAPGALDTLKEISDQLATDESAASALVTTVSGKLAKASNLSDLASPSGARMNLGLGPAALLDVGAPGEAGKVLRADEQGAFFGQRLLRILNEGVQDATVVIVGDSTSAGYAGTWVGAVIEGIAKRYPAYTVKYRDWTSGETDYNAASTKQTGTGERTLTVYNCAVASTNAYFQLAPNFENMIAGKQPDLIFFSHGHNHGGAGTLPGFWQEGLIIATQSILRACPTTEIVVFAQNPRTDAAKTVGAERQFITERVAQLSGFGFLNVHRLFLDADPTLATLISEDGIHPNATGYALQAAAVLSHLKLTGGVGSQQHPSLLVPASTNALLNGDFSEFASPPTLTSWTATNATLTKDETNFESPKGYSVKMASTTAATSRLEQGISGSSFKRLKGEWLTLLARVRIPTGQLAQAGQINLIETGGSHAGQNGTGALTASNGQGGWRWAMCQRRIAADATSMSVQILASSGANSGELSMDRVILVPGMWPRDIR